MIVLQTDTCLFACTDKSDRLSRPGQQCCDINVDTRTRGQTEAHGPVFQNDLRSPWIKWGTGSISTQPGGDHPPWGRHSALSSVVVVFGDSKACPGVSCYLSCEIKPCFISSDFTVLFGHNGCTLTPAKLLLPSLHGGCDGALQANLQTHSPSPPRPRWVGGTCTYTFPWSALFYGNTVILCHFLFLSWSVMFRRSYWFWKP